MPIDNENPITLGSGTLYLKDPATGENICFGPVGPTTSTIEADPAETIVVGRINTGAEATITINVPVRKMSRKRFVKKLMGAMVPRNIANSMADLVWLHGHAYAWGYMVIRFSGCLPWED